MKRPFFLAGETQETVLVNAALAARWKEPPLDALDRLVLDSVKHELLKHYEQIDFLPFDPNIKRTEGTLRDNRTGSVFKVTKGAPHIIMALLPPTDTHVREQIEHFTTSLGERGIRSLAVARTNEAGAWMMLGLLTFLDPPGPDMKQTIVDACKYGVKVTMITGDHLLITKNTSQTLDMGDLIFGSDQLPMLDPETKQKPANLAKNYGDLCLAADGFAQVYPEHKYLIVECLREMHFRVGMIGDGIDDAPALKHADIGIAVAGATDAARAAADIVFTQDGLTTIINGIVVSREIVARINNFITYRISATLHLLFFSFIAVFSFHPRDYLRYRSYYYVHRASYYSRSWPSFFRMPVLMLMLITLLNDGALITIAYDYAKASERPNRWNLPVLFVSSSVLGAVSCVSSLLLLHLLLDSWNPDGMLQKLGMQGVYYGQITTAMYLKISVSDFLTLFSARTGRQFFWKIVPAPSLLVGVVFALSLLSIVSIVLPFNKILPAEGLSDNLGVFWFVWIYCILFWFLQDACKVLAYWLMYKTNAFGISQSTQAVIPESTKQLMAAMRKAQQEENSHQKHKSH